MSFFGVVEVEFFSVPLRSAAENLAPLKFHNLLSTSYSSSCFALLFLYTERNLEETLTSFVTKHLPRMTREGDAEPSDAAAATTDERAQ